MERSRRWFTWLHLKILTAIVCCRTSPLGGHIDEAHVVFTLAGQLASLALQNKREIYGLLFRASAETLLIGYYWSSMFRFSTIFLRVVIVLFGIGTIALMLWEPHLEGRNVHATLFEIYFNDPFLAYAYISSISFFVALYQAFKLLGYIGRNEAFSQRSVKALRTIKHCAMALIALIVAAEAYLFIAVRGEDDIAGGVAVGLFLIFVSAVIATASAVFERLLQRAVEMK